MFTDLHEQLSTQKIQQLRAMITQRGATWQRTEKKVDLISRLVEFQMTAQPNDKHAVAKTEVKKPPAGPPPPLSPDEVRHALAGHIREGLEVWFDDGMWYFRYTKSPKIVREDSGTLRQPLLVVKRCADMLVRPRADAA